MQLFCNTNQKMTSESARQWVPALIMIVFYRWQCKDVAASLMTPVVAPSVRAVSSLTLVRARLISPVIGCGRLGAPSLVSSKVGAVKVLSTLACMEFFLFDARIRKWSTSSPYNFFHILDMIFNNTSVSFTCLPPASSVGHST